MNYEKVKITRRQFLTSLGVAAASALTIPLITSCESETNEQMWARLAGAQEAILAKRGINGQHDLIELKSVPGFTLSGEMSGAGFVFIGAFQGNIKGETTQNAWFKWKTTGDDPLEVISHLPLDKVAFIESNKDTGALVSFEFNDKQLVRNKGEADGLNYQPFDSPNPNDFIDPNVIDIARITLPASEIPRLIPSQ